MADESVVGSGASGLSCTTLLNLAATSYIKVKVDDSSFQLVKSGGGQSIPFILSSTAGGAALSIGSEADLTTTTLLSLFTGPDRSIPLFIRTTKTAGLVAGRYTGTITLRWYFSVCTAGALGVCATSSNGPGVTRHLISSDLTNWGSGVPVVVTVILDVLPDCKITAPDLAFGSAPLVGSFSPSIRTVAVRCSLDATYSVGLNDGENFLGTRRMRQGVTNNFLKYEIYRGTSVSSGRWGSATSTERRTSDTADSNPDIYDSNTLQGYTYRAVIDPAQATPPAGSYTDTIIVDISFF